jgi:hypothetical protein
LAWATKKYSTVRPQPAAVQSRNTPIADLPQNKYRVLGSRGRVEGSTPPATGSMEEGWAGGLQLHKIEEQDDVNSGEGGDRAAKTAEEGVLISWV